MTPNEQRLARRIHKQRIRLRQLETYVCYPEDRWRRWMNLALRLGHENRELRARLGEKPNPFLASPRRANQ